MFHKHFYNWILFVIVFTIALGAFASSNKAVGPAEALGKRIDDYLITSIIKAKYATAPILSDQEIHVTTEDSIVYLSGQLNTDQQYERAVIIAETTDYAKGVNTDKLTVKYSKHPLKDLYITAKIKGTLLKDKLIMGDKIEFAGVDIETKNGIVYLSGNVSTQVQKNNLLKAIHSIHGIKEIKDFVKIKPGSPEID